MLWPISTTSIRQIRAKGQHNLRSVNFDEQIDPTNPPCWEHGQHLVWLQLCQCICICQPVVALTPANGCYLCMDWWNTGMLKIWGWGESCSGGLGPRLSHRDEHSWLLKQEEVGVRGALSCLWIFMVAESSPGLILNPVKGSNCDPAL